MQTKLWLQIGALALLPASALSAAALPSDVLSQLNTYNVAWASPSTTGSAGSMPIGNGDITANVWVESGGDLVMYIGKSDNWSEGTRLLKTGRTRIKLTPNPFTAGMPFSQTLDLHQGEIAITAGPTGSKNYLRIWIDANHPVVRVEATGDRDFTMECKNEILRPNAYTLPTSGDPRESSFRGVTSGGTVRPSESADVVSQKTDRLVWYHRNTTSLYQMILNAENLSGFQATYPDPYLNRTFGGTMKGPKLNRIDNATLRSAAPGTSFALSLYAYTARTATAGDWDAQMAGLVQQVDAIDLETARTSHRNWWDAFWNRSWIFVTGDANAITVTRGYLLQRFMNACQGRGKYPIKFNGGTLTFDYSGQNGDYRKWGPGYWNQNERHIYWPMINAGDFDLMKPWFDFYKNMLPIQTAATNKYYGHGGAFFPETANFFGLFLLDDWGWTNSGGTYAKSGYMKYHYQSALEVVAMMLDYYEYTRDDAFASTYLVPFATQAIRFFDQHWPRVNGIINFNPANALEQFFGCTNPTDYIAGLRYDLPRLTALPASLTTAALRTEWANCFAALPPLPMSAGSNQILPAKTWGTPHNSENPECYAIWPYRLYGIGRPTNLEVARTTFNARLYKGSTCWNQAPIQAALLGLTSEAQTDQIANATSLDGAVRFPAFWKPNHDYIPDFDNGGAQMMGLQSMLMQNVGDSIRVLPSWPSNWSVDYKLWAPQNTSVRLKSSGGTVTQMDVFPVERADDVIAPGGGLPGPWLTGNVGPVAAAGSTRYSGGTFTVAGSGADIWGTTDEFRYVYQSASGDCSMTARVASVQNTQISAKAGVMIRESLNADSAYVAAYLTPQNVAKYEYRTGSGAGSTNGSSSSTAAPYWLRVTRVGNTFTAYRSSDGSSWSPLGSPVSIAMGANVFIGLPVCSHVDGTLCTTVITNVTAEP